MTKRQQIVALLKGGLNYTEIAEQARSSYKYVANVARDLNRPGCLQASTSKYRKKNRRKLRRQWRKNNPEKRREQSYQLVDFHQQKTRISAHNKSQDWTARELVYLEEHGKDRSIHQLAIDLGRTFAGVKSAAQRYGIDLRGDKVGMGALRFIGAYKSSKPINI